MDCCATSQLREEKFEQMYEEADDSVHLNVTRERFVKRMKMAVTKLKAVDENLAFQRDVATEEWTGHGDDESYSVFQKSYLLAAVQKLQKDGKSVTVCFDWTTDGKFLDLSVLPALGTSEEYQVPGVSAQHYSVGNRVLDW